MMNHSCTPNCVILFSGNELIVKCIEEIKSGDELFISYTETATSYEIRKADLQKRYFFKCDCPRCQKGTIRKFLCLICSHELGDKWKCNSCETVHEKVLYDRMLKNAQEAHEKAVKYRKEGMLEKAKEEAEKAWKMKTRILGNKSEDVVQTTTLLTNICIDAQEFNEALKYGKLTIQPYESILF